MEIGLFLLFAIISYAARNICVQAFVWADVFICLGYACRSGIDESYGNSVFNILKNCQPPFLLSGLCV